MPVFWACGVTPQAVALASQAAVHDHAQPRPHVHHRPAELRRWRRSEASSAIHPGGRSSPLCVELGDEISVGGQHARPRARVPDPATRRCPASSRRCRASARCSSTTIRARSATSALCAAHRARWPSRPSTAVLPPSRLVELPCCYDDPSSASTSTPPPQRLGLRADELVAAARRRRVPRLLHRLHAGAAVHDRACPSASDMPRLETPRTKMPPGSVGHRRHPVLHLLGREPGRLLDARAHAGARSTIRSAAEPTCCGRATGCAFRPIDRARVRRASPPRVAARDVPAGDRVIAHRSIAGPADDRAGPRPPRAAPLRHSAVGPDGPCARSCSPTASSATPTAPPALECTLIGPALRGGRRRARSR